MGVLNFFFVYIYCKIYYGGWVPDFALDGLQAILCNTIFEEVILFRNMFAD